MRLIPLITFFLSSSLTLFDTIVIAQIEQHWQSPSTLPATTLLTKTKLNNLYGYENNSQQLVIPYQYEDADYFYEDLAAVQQGIFYGYINTNNEVVIPMQYDFAWSFAGPLAVVKQGGKWGLIDKKGQLKTPLRYDYIGLTSKSRYENTYQKSRDRPYFSHGLIRAEQQGKCGFLDTFGKVAIPLKYEQVWNFSAGLAGVVQGGKAGFVDTKGKIKIPLKYDYVWSFSNGLAVVEKNNKLGAINTTGQLIVPVAYDKIMPLDNGQWIVHKLGQQGVIDSTGKFVIPLSSNRSISQKGEFYILQYKYEKGLFNQAGKQLIDGFYNDIQVYPKLQLIRLDRGNRHFGLADYDGNIVLPLKHKYFNLNQDQQLHVIAKNDYEFGLIDNTGNFFWEVQNRKYGKLQYGWISISHQDSFFLVNLNTKAVLPWAPIGGHCIFFSPNLIRVQQEMGFRLYDTKKRQFISATYDEINGYSENYSVVKKDNQYGFIDTSGQVKIPLIYNEVFYFKGGTAHAIKNDTAGQLSKEGTFIPIPHSYYTQKMNINATHIFFRKEQQHGIVNTQTGDTILPPKYHVEFDKDKYLFAIYNSAKKQSWIDRKAQLVVPFEYDYISPFQNQVAVVHQGGKKGVINKKGKLITPLVYDAIRPLCEGILAVTQNGKSGLIDDSGKRTTPLVYDRIIDCKLGAIEMVKNGKVGLLDYTGKEVTSFEYDAIQTSTNLKNAAVVVKKVKEQYQYGIIHKTTKEVTPIIYDQILPINAFTEHVKVRKGNNWGVIHINGQVIVPCQYYMVNHYENGHIFVAERDTVAAGIIQRMGVYNFLGEQFIPCQYHNISHYKDDYFFVSNNNKIGILNNRNEIIIPIIYDQLQPKNKYSKNPLFLVKSGDKKGILNEQLEWILPPEYDWITLEENHFIVSKNDKSGWLDLEGNVLIPLIYDRIGKKTEQGLIAVWKDNKTGFIDAKGNTIVPVVYNSIGYYNDGLYQLKKEGKFGVVDTTGNIIVACQYDRVYYSKLGNRGILGLVKDGDEELLDSKTLTPFLSQEYSQIKFLGYSSTKALLVQDGDKFQLLDLNGKPISHPPFDAITIWNEYLMITKGDKKGLIDFDGKVILPAIYNDINNSLWGLFEVQQQNKRGLVNQQGKIILPTIYDAIQVREKTNTIELYLKGKKGLAKRDGTILLACKYDVIKRLPNQIVYVKQGNKYGLAFTDKDSIQCIYDKIEQFSKEKMIVQLGDQQGIIDKNQNIVLPIIYDQIYKRGNTIMKDGKIGFINPSGVVTIPPTYDSLSIGRNRFYTTYKEGKCGLSTLTGDSVLPMEYDAVGRISDDWWIPVKKHGKWGLVDMTNQLIIPFEYDFIYRISANFFQVKKAEKVGYIDRQNNIIIPIEYDYIAYPVRDYYRNQPSELFPAKKDDKWGYLDKQGNALIPFIYQEATSFNRKEALVTDMEGNKFYIDARGIKTPTVYKRIRGDYQWSQD